MMSRAQNWLFSLQLLLVLAMLLGGMTMLYAYGNGYSTNSNSASSTHSHTWTCDEDGHLVVPDTHCPSVLRRHDGLLNKRDVRNLLLGPPCATKETLDSIRVSDVRKSAFLLGGTGGRSSGNPNDGPV